MEKFSLRLNVELGKKERRLFGRLLLAQTSFSVVAYYQQLLFCKRKVHTYALRARRAPREVGSSAALPGGMVGCYSPVRDKDLAVEQQQRVC